MRVVSTISRKSYNIEIEQSTIETYQNGWISAFVLHSHDEDGHSYFEPYHLTLLHLKDNLRVFDLAMDEIAHAADDALFHRIQDHPFLDMGRLGGGFAKGAYDASTLLQHTRQHPAEMRKLILRMGAARAVNWLLIPNLLFQTAKHAAHFIRAAQREPDHHLHKFVYVRSNLIGGTVFMDGPWTAA